jgi:penicillin-binding protein 2
VRGRILDRNGYVLASEEPAWHISVHYGLISEDPDYLEHVARTLKLDPAQTHERVADLWRQLSRLSGISTDEIELRRHRILRRVELIRRDFERRHGYETTMREEVSLHPIVRDLDDQQQVRVRLALDEMPGVRVESATARRRLDVPSMGHLLGRLGEVDERDLTQDPNRDDPLLRYRAGDQIGKAGLEFAGESMLRGRRGQVVENRDGEVIKRVEPTRGADVVTTLDLPLQQRIYEQLALAVEAHPQASGAAAVILDIESRHILALASYPGFEPSSYRRDFDELAADQVGTPLLWRAVTGRYAPGSIVKPLVLSAAWSTGVVSTDFSVDCRGALFPEHPNRWREWRNHATGHPVHHGLMAGQSAIMHSCQIFFYTLGERLGGRRLCDWYQMAGFGRPAGLGLLEEPTGLVPTPTWLAENRDRRDYLKADGRNYGVGQGELLITPVQAANLAAVYATGAYMPVTLIANDGRERGMWRLPVNDSTWRTIRRGMWQVVNERGGTAFGVVNLDSDQFEICGKSGSAEASTRIVAFEADWTDEDGLQRTEYVPAQTRTQARRRIASMTREPGDEVHNLKLRPTRWWPYPPDPNRPRPSHAWFIGFVQPKSDGSFRTNARPAIAFAVMIEYGGSGGRTAGPVAAEIVRILIEDFPHFITSNDFATTG